MFKLFKPRASPAHGKGADSDPRNALAQYKLGNSMRIAGRLNDACECYDRAVEADPVFANAYCNRGVVLALLGRSDEALASYDRAVALNPRDSIAFYNRGALLRELGKAILALDSIESAINIDPQYAEAHCNRGIILMELERWAAAEGSFEKAIEINPSFAKAWSNWGVLQQKCRRWDAAVASYDRAFELDPNDLETLEKRSKALAALNRWTEALTGFDTLISLKPDHTKAHVGRGSALLALGRHALAMENFDRAVELDPNDVDAIVYRAHSLTQLRNFEAGIDGLDHALTIEPRHPFLLGNLAYARMNVCDWKNWSTDVERLVAGVEANELVTPPFQLVAAIDAPLLHRKAATLWTQHEFPVSDAPQKISGQNAAGKIRIGYFSADFREHPVSMLLAEVFQTHDRNTFNLTAFSYGPPSGSDMRRRLEQSFDRFIDVSGHSDHSIALLARTLRIDLAIDLMGHTANTRMGIFALRVAPLQIGYLGYPGTTGAEYFDYLIGDRVVTPPYRDDCFTEKIVRLPGCYLPNDSTRHIADTAYNRNQLGLPPTGFVFCCFNNSFKISPQTFDSWINILRRVEHSALWLSQNNEVFVRNLRMEAERQNLDPSRLVFAERFPSAAEHLARHKLADLFLDTRPYNAHATAIDALWAGLPVLTCRGESFASRVGASLLTAIHLPELITATPAEYEDRAVHLASHPAELAQLRTALANNRLSTPLFDTASSTHNLEKAYTQIYARYQSGLPPEQLDII